MTKISPNPPPRAARSKKGTSWPLIDSIGCLLARSGPILALLIAVLFSQRGVAEDQEEKAEQLATDVWKASGGENWENVKDVRFNFVVEQDGKEIFKAEHVWDVPANTDDVKWKDKHVKVNLAAPASDEDSKSAYARWVNDSYWLLAPLKVRDPGVHVKTEGMKEADGANCQTLRLSFDKVGLTPNDQYVLYIDPASHLVRAWDYIPTPDKIIHGSWEKYQSFSGLYLSTEHEFNGKIIRLSDIKVTMAK